MKRSIFVSSSVALMLFSCIIFAKDLEDPAWFPGGNGSLWIYERLPRLPADPADEKITCQKSSVRIDGKEYSCIKDSGGMSFSILYESEFEVSDVSYREGINPFLVFRQSKDANGITYVYGYAKDYMDSLVKGLKAAEKHIADVKIIQGEDEWVLLKFKDWFDLSWTVFSFQVFYNDGLPEIISVKGLRNVATIEVNGVKMKTHDLTYTLEKKGQPLFWLILWRFYLTENGIQAIELCGKDPHWFFIRNLIEYQPKNIKSSIGIDKETKATTWGKIKED